MPAKLFTIITPTLNPGRKLEETINSVLSQRESLFEYIIIDGGSTDGTLETIRRYGGRIKFVSEGDKNVYDAMNKGLEVASGEYLYFLGAGDVLRKGVLERIETSIPDKHPAFVYGNVFLLDRKKKYAGKFGKAKIARTNICHQAIFYERSIFELVGKFDLKYNLLADHAFNIKCFGDERIHKAYVDELIADYEGCGISRGTDPNFIKDRWQIVKETFGLKWYLLCFAQRCYPTSVLCKLQLLISHRR